jgi:RNA polymerase sigma-70 factor (ECF subfamily)
MRESPATHSPPEDRELVARAKEGSPVAFEALVRRHHRALYFVCLRYVRDHDLAAEMAQRALIRALESLAQLRDGDTFAGWLFKIGVNLALNHLRDSAKFVDEAALEHRAAPKVAPLEGSEESTALRSAVARLPPRQRKLVELRVYEELSFREIARALDTSANAAKVSFHHAKKNLRRLLLEADALAAPSRSAA